MRMYVILETTEDFDDTQLDHPLVTHHDKVVGAYTYVAYFADVTVTQAVQIVNTLANDSEIIRFTPLLAYQL